MKQSGIAVTLLTIQCFRMFQRPKWHRRRSHPYQLQLAVSPTEQFCRVHHNLWILSLFILKVSFFHRMYERINGGHERDCSQVPFDPTVFCMSAVGFLSFRLCELSSYHIICTIWWYTLSYPTKSKNRFHRMERKSQTRSEKPNMLKMPRILWDIFWFLWHFDRSCQRWLFSGSPDLSPSFCRKWCRGMSPGVSVPSRCDSLLLFSHRQYTMMVDTIEPKCIGPTLRSCSFYEISKSLEFWFFCFFLARHGPPVRAAPKPRAFAEIDSLSDIRRTAVEAVCKLWKKHNPSDSYSAICMAVAWSKSMAAWQHRLIPCSIFGVVINSTVVVIWSMNLPLYNMVYHELRDISWYYDMRWMCSSCRPGPTPWACAGKADGSMSRMSSCPNSWKPSRVFRIWN